MGDVAILPDLPGVGGLIAKAAVTTMGRSGAAGGIPDRAVMVMDHKQDAARLAAYNRVCGFPLRDAVPPTWLHVLTFPLHAEIMARRDFPFPMAGIVHVTNEMTLHRPVTVMDRLRITVKATNMAPHKRGVTFDMVGEIHVGDDLAWSGTSNYIALKAHMDGTPPEAVRLSEPEAPASQFWRLPADLGRQYAAVSGDNNPIHLHPATSRLFGFKRPIIHGMWTHARALAALTPRLPGTYTARVAFTKPISMPGRATFAADPHDEGWRFAVRNTDQTKTYLVGEVAP